MTYPRSVTPGSIRRTWNRIVPGSRLRRTRGLGPPSSWRHVESLDAYLRRYRVCASPELTPAPSAPPSRRGSQMRPARSDLDADRLGEKPGAPFLWGATGEGVIPTTLSLDHGTGPREGTCPPPHSGNVRTRPRIVGSTSDQAEHPADDGLPAVRRDVVRRRTARTSSRTLRMASSCRTGRGTEGVP